MQQVASGYHIEQLNSRVELLKLYHASGSPRGLWKHTTGLHSRVFVFAVWDEAQEFTFLKKFINDTDTSGWSRVQVWELVSQVSLNSIVSWTDLVHVFTSPQVALYNYIVLLSFYLHVYYLLHKSLVEKRMSFIFARHKMSHSVI